MSGDPFALDGAAAPAHAERRHPGRRSVGRRLALTVAVVVGLLVLVVTWSMVAFTALAGRIDRLHRTDVVLAEAAGDLRSEVAGMLQSQSAYVLNAGEGRAAFETRLDRVDVAMGRLSRLVERPADVALVTKMRSELGAFRSVDTHVWSALQDGRLGTAHGLIAGPNALTVSLLENDATALADRARAEQDAGLRRVDRLVSTSRLAVLVIGVVATAVGAFLAVHTARRVREPLGELESAARRAAGGDLDVVVEVGGDDETGRLAEAFNAMIDLLRRSVRNGAFDTQLRAALEMVDTEPEVIQVLGEAVNEVVPAYPTEFLLADPVKAHMEQSTVRGPLSSGPQCPVDSPFGCAAIRSGQVAVFPSSGELGACPHLRNRPYGMVSAACVPVMFMGRALGVIHTTGPAGQPLPDADVERLRVLAGQAGSRIGMVRAFDRTHLQATTDALTGLPNRRSLEARAVELEAKAKDYAVVMFDLDRFKALNDTYGHEVGDRALRRFATVLRESVRPKDLAARFGGEEFVVVLPASSAALALSVAERVRTRLAELTAGSDAPAFTVSAGIATSGQQGAFETVLRAADAALYQAKALGRDRSVLGDGEDPTGDPATWPTVEPEDPDANPWPVREPDPIFDRM